MDIDLACGCYIAQTTDGYKVAKCPTHKSPWMEADFKNRMYEAIRREVQRAPRFPLGARIDHLWKVQ